MLRIIQQFTVYSLQFTVYSFQVITNALQYTSRIEMEIKRFLGQCHLVQWPHPAFAKPNLIKKKKLRFLKHIFTLSLRSLLSVRSQTDEENHLDFFFLETVKNAKLQILRIMSDLFGWDIRSFADRDFSWKCWKAKLQIWK